MYENEDNTKVHTRYYLPKIKKHYNILIDGNNLFDQLFKSNIRTYNKTCKIATAEGDVYTSSCLIVYNYLKKYHKTIATDYNRKGY